MKNINKKVIKIETTNKKKIKAIVLSNKKQEKPETALLWIHGGGYFLGMKEMVYMSRALNLVKKYNAVVISPGYRLSLFHPYPAALNDCYSTLLYILSHYKDLNIDKNQIMVGGEIAGGGLAIALSLLARDKKEVNIASLFPLYPMIDNLDTPSSINNKGKIWNTKRNHLGWKLYLRKRRKQNVESYASPSRETNFNNLPPTYTFVGNGEPFYFETITYINNLKNNNIEASVDIYESNIHAFDMLYPNKEISKVAIAKFESQFEYAKNHYFAINK